MYDLLPARTSSPSRGATRGTTTPQHGVRRCLEPERARRNRLPWNDANHDRHFHPGEEDRLLFTFGGTSITSVDPNLMQPHTDEVPSASSSRHRDRSASSTLDGIRRCGGRTSRRPRRAFRDRRVHPRDRSRSGAGWHGGNVDDQRITVFNLVASTLGKQHAARNEPVGLHHRSSKGSRSRRSGASRTAGSCWRRTPISKNDLSRAAIGVGAFGGEEEGAGARAARSRARTANQQHERAELLRSHAHLQDGRELRGALAWR